MLSKGVSAIFFRSPKAQALRASERKYSTKNQLGYIPHKFDKQEAGRMFVERDRKRLFAPSLPATNTSSLAVSRSDPLKKMALPFFCGEVQLQPAKYNAEYGITHTYETRDHKGNTTTHTYTIWHPISGTLPAIRFDETQEGMKVYAGLQWADALLEQAFSGYQVIDKTIPFDITKIAPDTEVDPFLKKAALAQSKIQSRVDEMQMERAQKDASMNSGSSQIRILLLNYEFHSFKLTPVMFGGYLLTRFHCPPMVLPAIENNTAVFGTSQISVGKATGAAAIVSTVAAILLPQYSIPLRVLCSMVIPFLTALGAKYHLQIQDAMEQRTIRKTAEENEELAESINDRLRREATEKAVPNVSLIAADQKYFAVLGLDPNQPYTEDDIRKAYYKEIKAAHPDSNGNTVKSNQKASELNQARTVLTQCINNKMFKRQYSTLAAKKTVQTPPRSLFHPRAGELIETVLDKKNYPKALQMVLEQEISPDSHDKGENTLLTEAVKRGNLEAVIFITEKLGASLDTSCDCPAHNTPLHYAKDPKIVEYLLKAGARPNLINSFGKTTLDVATAKGRKEVAEVLIRFGGIHNNMEKKGLMQSIFGYKPEDRTMLLENSKSNPNALDDGDEVIYLPSSFDGKKK